MRRAITVIGFAFLAGGAAMAMSCASRKHMSEDFGHASRRIFRAQPVHASPPETGPQPAGLEPDEAQIVYENYRRSLAAKGSAPPKGGKSGIILVDDEDAKKKLQVAP